jgi:hypothetical protein
MKALAEQIADLDSIETYGRVVGVRGEAFLSQLKEESTSMAEGYQRLEQILQGQQPDQA